MNKPQEISDYRILGYTQDDKQELKNRNMAKPIKETPILTGRDATNFFQQMKDAEKKKISVGEANKIKANADRLKTIFK